VTQAELDRIFALPVQMRASEVQVAWCAKEAGIKAARKPIEPTEIDVERDPSGGDFVAFWRAPGPEMPPAEIWQGRTARSQGLILAAVVRPASPSKQTASREAGLRD
jgi:hypothetical protein